MLNKKSLIIISIIGIMFGYWFAKMQLHAVSPDALASYPAFFLGLTVVKCTLTVAAVFVISYFFVSIISAGKVSSVSVACSLSPLLLVYLHVPLLWVAAGMVLALVYVMVVALDKEDYQRLRASYAIDVALLLVLLGSHFLLTTAFSPLHWDMALLASNGFNSEEIPVVAPVFKGYLLAKQYAFTNLDHAQWAAIMNPPGTLDSPFMQMLTLIFDLPSVSYESFHRVLMSVYFFLIVAGSFGFYLFLRYAAKISILFAFFGGVLFCFSGSPLLLGGFTSDGGIFFTAQAVFPYALLLISLAYEKNDARYAAWAGLALASQFFLLTPHPEGTIYVSLFYGIFTAGLFFFTRNVSWYRRFLLGLISVLVYFGLSAFYLVPLIIDRVSGNMYVFAHMKNISHTYIIYFLAYIKLIAIFAPISLVLLWKYKKITPVFLSSLLLALVLWKLTVLSTDQSFNVWLVETLHLGLHIWCPPRMGAYFYISSFIIAMFGLDNLCRLISGFIHSRLRMD